MKNIETLIKKATELKAEGLVEGQISEELNVSSETVTWLLTHAAKTSTSPGPKDISVDWSMIGKSAFRLSQVSEALSDIIYETLDDNDCGVDVVVGIALSGLPLASMAANSLAADLAVYTPSKQMLTKESGKARGNLSANFSGVMDKECIIVDDVITSGRTPFSSSVFRSRSSVPAAITPVSTMNNRPFDQVSCPEASAAWTYQT